MPRTSGQSVAHMQCPPLSPAKCRPPVLSESCSQSTDDDMNEMPILTPEVPFESVSDSPLWSPAIRPVDLVPPVLSPALDDHKPIVMTSDGKSRHKRKSKVDTFANLEDSVYEFNTDHFVDDPTLCDNISVKKVTKSPKKSKMSQFLSKSKKLSQNMDKRKTIFQEKSKKSYLKDYKVFHMKKKSGYKKMKTNYSNASQSLNGWSVDSNHTLSSVNGLNTGNASTHSMNTLSYSHEYDTNSSFVSQNSTLFDNSFKIRSKVFKSKSLFKSRSPRCETNGFGGHNKSMLANELNGLHKPEAEEDQIEGILFKSFESEDAITLYSKFETLEREQKEQSSSDKTYRFKSLKSGKLIYPTKTKDITKIKGWREKLFSSIDEKQSKRPFTLPFEKNTSTDSHNIFKPLISDDSIGHSSGSKSAFVSDLLDGYLKTKSDLRVNYLCPDFAAPPDDSPIFSAGVLKMPELTNNSMLPPPTPSTSQTSPLKKKNSFGRSKGLKNKQKLKTDFSDSTSFLDDEDVSNIELLLPQYPVIRETHWPDKQHSDEHMMHLYNTYIDTTYRETQLMKRPTLPSFIMDDLYARFALSALQCNERIPDPIESPDSPDSVLMAVGLTPKVKPVSPIKENKITGRYRKDRDADLAKIIAMGNRSKRQIRLPSRFHESSLLMGNQWVIPDYDSKGKTGKRRLQDEQKRLQELHQKQLQMEQRFQTQTPTSDANGSNSDDSSQTQLSLMHKKFVTHKPLKMKLKSVGIGTSVGSHYQLKIPHQRLKQMQLIRDQKNQMKAMKLKTNKQSLNNSFKSLYSMSETVGDKRILSLSAKAQASASQRAHVNVLFRTLTDAMAPTNGTIECKNGKLNKLETIKEAIETINKLVKREQQLCYIRKLLSMWNHKLQLCQKVSQKDMTLEAYKVVDEVMNAYKGSMCYKVGQALEDKRREFQQKRAEQLQQQKQQQKEHQKQQQIELQSKETKPKKFNLFKKFETNKTQCKGIPVPIPAIPFKMPINPMKTPNQRYILPKLIPISTNSLDTTTETLVMSGSGKYPTLTPPDLQPKSVNHFSIDEELNKQEGSLLKPPILTTRPTILKPFIVPHNDALHTSSSVTGPIINVPNISRIKSMTKSLNACKTSTSLIATPKHSLNSQSFITNSRLNLSSSGISSNTSIQSIGSTGDSNGVNVFNTHSLANKITITSETPLATEDLSKIVASLTANPDKLKKVPVRLSNGMTALSIPGPIDMASNFK